MTLTPERIADMREALDADPDLDSVTSRRTTFLALLDAADKLARLRDDALDSRLRMMREGNYVYQPAPNGPQPEYHV